MVSLADHHHRRPNLDESLRRWVGAGLITPEQARAIEGHERGAIPEPPERREPRPARFAPEGGPRPSLAEALGYVGGVLALAGVFLVVAQFWVDLALGARLAMTITAAIGLFVAGWAVTSRDVRPAFVRLRTVLWTLSTAATALTAGLIAAESVSDGGRQIAFAASFAAMVQSGALWAGRIRPVHQFFFLAAGLVAAGTGVAIVGTPGVSGAVVWALGLGLALVGLRHRIVSSELALAVGAAGSVVGAIILATEWQGPGLLVALATGLGWLSLTQLREVELRDVERLIVLGVGLILFLQTLPGTLGYFSQEAGLVTGLALWLAGAALLAVGLREMVRAPVLLLGAGGLAMVGGAALTATQWTAFALMLGLLTAIALVTLGALVDRTTVSTTGLLGLLANVPWAIDWFFPGEGRVPLMLVAVGALIVAAAVVLARTTRRRG
jgi:hypothetical protein